MSVHALSGPTSDSRLRTSALSLSKIPASANFADLGTPELFIMQIDLSSLNGARRNFDSLGFDFAGSRCRLAKNRAQGLQAFFQRNWSQLRVDDKRHPEKPVRLRTDFFL